MSRPPLPVRDDDVGALLTDDAIQLIRIGDYFDVVPGVLELSGETEVVVRGLHR